VNLILRVDKLKYEFDPHNRLTATSKALKGVRKVLDGQFRISANNTLTYQVKTPVPNGIEAPHQLELKGTWSLTDDHQLRLTLEEWRRKTFGDQLVLRGEIIDVRRNSLLFSVTTKTKDNMPSSYLLELSGSWQADKHNRITFKVDKEQSRPDLLIFNGAWQIDENYKIIYTCQNKQLVRKNKQIRSLAFKGRWDIRNKARLSYIIDADSDSKFNFSTSAGVFRNGYIQYELGIGLSSRKQPVKRSITFSGKWKIKRGLGLVFEVQRGEGKIQEIVFGAEANLGDKGRVSFNLRNSLNKKVGAELELSRDIFQGDGQAFLRLLESKQESAIIAGVGWKW
jgi:hypothetical protein